MIKKLNTAIVGLGFGQRVLLPVCESHPGINVCRVLSSADDFELMLTDDSIELVIIASPHQYHAEQVRRALESSKHVLVEKPLALNSVEATDLVRLATEQNLVGAMDYSFLLIPARAYFAELIHSGILGHLKSLRLSFHREDFEHWPRPWYYLPREGGGAVVATGSHLIASVRYIANSPICQVKATVQFRGEVDVGFRASLTTQSGCTCEIDVSHVRDGEGKHIIEAQGEKGFLTLGSEDLVSDMDGKKTILQLPESTKLGFGNQSWGGPVRLQPTARIIDILVNQIRNPFSDFFCGIANGAEDVKVVEAIFRSSQNQQEVNIPKGN